MGKFLPSFERIFIELAKLSGSYILTHVWYFLDITQKSGLLKRVGVAFIEHRLSLLIMFIIFCATNEILLKKKLERLKLNTNRIKFI
jgi:hypothetical protein